MVTPSEREQIERLETAVRTMAWWLVAAQTGFGQRDAQGIEEILRGEREQVEGHRFEGWSS